jgi:hypothetical protein
MTAPINATSINTIIGIYGSNDSTTLPTYSWSNDSKTGMWHASNKAIGFTIDGSNQATLCNVGINIIGSLYTNNQQRIDLQGALSNITINTDLITSGTLSNARLFYTSISNAGIVQLIDSTQSQSLSNAPTAIALSNIANLASNALLRTGGTMTAPINATSINPTIGIYGGTDSKTQPTYSWSNDSNTGLYHPSTSSIGFAINGSNQATLCNIGLNIIGSLHTNNLQRLDPQGALSNVTINTDLITSGVLSNARLFYTSTSNAGIVQLIDSTQSQSLSNAPTAIALSNIANLASNALLRTGGTMTSPLNATTINTTVGIYGSNDSTTLPTYSWSNDSNTGMYHATLDAIGFAANGSNIATLCNTGLNITIGSLYTSNIQRIDNSGNLVNVSIDGSKITSGVIANARLPIATTGSNGIVQLIDSTQSQSLSNAPTSLALSNIANLASNALLRTGGTMSAPINATSINTTIGIYGSNDSVSFPTYSWSNDSNTGMYHAALDAIGFTIDGTNKVTLCNLGLYVNGLVSASNLTVQPGTATWDKVLITHDGSLASIKAGGADTGLALMVNTSTSGDAANNPYSTALTCTTSRVTIASNLTSPSISASNISTSNLIVSVNNSAWPWDKMVLTHDGNYAYIKANGADSGLILMVNTTNSGDPLTNAYSTALTCTTSSVTVASNLIVNGTTNTSSLYTAGVQRIDNSGNLVTVSIDGSKITSGTIANVRLPIATTGANGIVKLSDSISSTSSSEAATSAAVKQAYDLANNALPKTGGTVTGYTYFMGSTGLAWFPAAGYTNAYVSRFNIWEGDFAFTAKFEYNIFVSHSVMFGSDKRIKENIERAPTQELKNIVKDLELVKFQYKKQAYNSPTTLNKELGCIADQVETICPDLVNYSPHYIPNIMKMVKILKAKGNTITVLNNISKEVELSKHTKLQVMLSPFETKINGIVSEISETRLSIVLPEETNLEDYNEVFIVGSEVNNFRTINLNKLVYTLLGAVQDVIQDVESIKKRVDKIQSQYINPM